MNYFPISNSRLNAFKKSPKHFIQYLTDKQPETAAQRFGKAFHMYILQPEQFVTAYAVAPPTERRSKLGKEIYEQFMVDHVGKDIITTDDMDSIHRMADALQQDTMANELITNLIHRENDRQWMNDETMTPMRGIIDGVGSTYMIDLKTTADADPFNFYNTAIRSGYHRQAAIYLDSDTEPMDFYIIAVEKDAPFGISIHELDYDLIMKGRDEFIRLIEDLKSWIELGSPNVGYSWRNPTGIFKMTTPKWMESTS